MSDDSVLGALILGATIFALFGGCDRLDGGSYQLVTSGDTVYRLNKHDGRVSLVTKEGVESIRENRPLHWWDRLQMSDDAVSWSPQKFHKDQYSCTLITRWSNERLRYILKVTPGIEHPGHAAKLTLLLQDRFGMKLVKEDVLLSQMDTGVDKDDKVTGLIYHGEIKTDERTVKDAVHWHVLWDGF